VTTRLAIVGGGAKAAAIAAKAHSLTRLGLADIEVTIFERSQVACNWHGDHGYTDGAQGLCTSITRDVGFPYEHDVADVNEYMMSTYSWPAHLVRNGGHTDWVNRHSDRPSHQQFHRYLSEVIALSGAEVLERTEVVGLTPRRRQWLVRARPVGGPARAHGPYDAVVVTGPGPAREDFDLTDHRFFNGEDVWQRLPELMAAIEACDERIVLIGSGGTAAAIAAWLVAAGYGDREIWFVARQATLYTRTANYFEDRVFQDEEIWGQLGPQERRQFVDRLTRSVVWEAVTEQLSLARAIRVQPGRATSVAETDDGVGETLTVMATPSLPGAPPIEIEASAVIDATGFNEWWFVDLLPPDQRATSLALFKKRAETVDYFLRFPWRQRSPQQAPPLHTPTISFAAGPGFNSLMALGLMADRILWPYRTDRLDPG
jgi:mycobactin lysine-N-oxygenase